MEITPMENPVRRRFRRLAWTAVAFTYALIVLGGIVRITGSGMACGEDWPLCRGRWLPTLDAPTLLEYGHRLIAGGVVGLLVLALATYAVRHRRLEGFSGKYGVLRPALLALALVVTVALLGALTVRWITPPVVVTLHFAVAMATLAVLLVAALRATPLADAATASGAPVMDRTARKAAGAALGAAALAYLVVVFGAVVANTGAAPLCQGFPLCSGRLIPQGGALVHIHLTHRVLAYLLVVHVAGAAIAAWRRPVTPAVRWAASGAAGLVGVQIAVAAALVVTGLPRSLQALHLAVGTAVWGALVVWAVLARRAASRVAVSSSGTG